MNETDRITADAIRAATDRRLAEMREIKIIIPIKSRRLPPRARRHSVAHRAYR